MKASPESREDHGLPGPEPRRQRPFRGGNQHRRRGGVAVAVYVAVEPFGGHIEGPRHARDEVAVGLMHQKCVHPLGANPGCCEGFPYGPGDLPGALQNHHRAVHLQRAGEPQSEVGGKGAIGM